MRSPWLVLGLVALWPAVHASSKVLWPTVGCVPNDAAAGAYSAGWQERVNTNVYRIDWPLFLRVDVGHLLQCLLLFAVFDWAIACRTKARWFVLHLFANALVVVTAWPDVVTTLRDPANGIVTRDYSVWPTYFIASIHAYHCIAFSNLTMDDWVHHIVFGGTICTVGLVFKCGPVLGLLSFFLSGLPGGLDYLMLTLVKHGFLSADDEKRYNARIMVWVRSPGCMLCAFCIYTSWRYRIIETTLSQDMAAWIVALLCLVNGQYYMQVVVGNTHKKVQGFSC